MLLERTREKVGCVHIEERSRWSQVSCAEAIKSVRSVMSLPVETCVRLARIVSIILYSDAILTENCLLF